MPHFSASGRASGGGESNHRRHAITVLVEVGEGLNSSRLKIRSHALNHGVEVLVRNVVMLYRIEERGPGGVVVGMSGEGFSKGIAPTINCRAGGAGFIAEVVAVAHESVDRAHRVLFFGREQDERVIEITGAGFGYGAAVGLGLFERSHRVPPVPRRLPTLPVLVGRTPRSAPDPPVRLFGGTCS